jgi:sulfoxide reductase heme-binding subunit YedZ
MAASDRLADAAPRPVGPPRATRASGRPLPWLKPGIYLGALVPLVSILVRASRGTLSANPIAQAMNELGLTALILLVASLACTPARHLLGWTWPVRIRRDLGLLAFFYAVLHFLTYLVLDQTVDLAAIVQDVVKRPFITVGVAALALLVPLALTSTSASVRRLGFRRWQRLHRLIYVAGALAIVHFVWRVKVDLTQPLIYGLIVAALLAVRLAVWRWPPPSKRTTPR